MSLSNHTLPPQGRREILAARLPLAALFSANAISMVGNTLSSIAIPWFILQTTGSPALTGLAAFFNTLPIPLAGLLGGVLVDRFGYRRSSVLADLLSGVSVALIPLLYATLGLDFVPLLALVFLGAMLDAPGGTAREVLVPLMAERAGVRLETANAVNDGVMRATRLVGAPLAGLIIAVLGATTAMWLDALSFLLSAWLIGRWIPSEPVRPVQPSAAGAGFWRELAEGLQYLRREPVIRMVVLIVMATNLIDGALFSVALPVYVRDQFSSAVPMGWMVSAVGGGAVLGAAAFSAWGARWPRRLVLCLGFLVASLRFFALAAFPSLPVLVAVHALAGLSLGPVNPLLSTIQFERIPANLRARVYGAITAGVMMAVPLGVLVCGFFLEAAGMPLTLLLLGGAYALSSLGFWGRDLSETEPAGA